MTDFLYNLLEDILGRKIVKFFYNLLAITIFILLILLWLTDNYVGIVVLVILALLFFFGILHLYRRLNDQTIRQFAVMNQQLKLRMKYPAQPFFNMEWVYPNMRGVYRGRYLAIVSYKSIEAGKVVPRVAVTLDVIHYGKIFSLKPEDFSTALKKLKEGPDIITGDDDFDARFYVESNDARFMKNLLDDDIRDILMDNVFNHIGKFTLSQGQLKYSEALVLNTTEERRRFEYVILVLHMMAKRMELMRIGKA